jgi:hypothetical protein
MAFNQNEGEVATFALRESELRRFDLTTGLAI